MGHHRTRTQPIQADHSSSDLPGFVGVGVSEVGRMAVVARTDPHPRTPIYGLEEAEGQKALGQIRIAEYL